MNALMTMPKNKEAEETMESLGDFSVPKELIDFVKAKFTKPFKYLEFDLTDLPEASEYVTRINVIFGIKVKST